MGKRQRYPAFQPFSASRSQKQEKARRVDDKTLLSPAGHDPRDHLFSLPRRQRPRGRIFAVLLAPLVDDSTRTTGCTSRRAENVTTNRCYETLRALGQSQGGTHGRRHQSTTMHERSLAMLSTWEAWPQSSRRLRRCGLAGAVGPGAAAVARSRYPAEPLEPLEPREPHCSSQSTRPR